MDRAATLAEAHETIAHLEFGLRSSRRIGMAVGIVMARYGVGEHEAFARLVRSSQRNHRKLREIAEDVILVGDVPDHA